MRRITSVAWLVAVILLAMSVFWTYRAKAAADATEFQPASNAPVSLPMGTVIQAEIRNRFPSSAEAGDTMTAFVSKQVISDHTLAIPADALLKGPLEKLTVTGSEGRAVINFDRLLIGRQSFAIHTRPSLANGEVMNDLDVLRSGLKLLMGTALGTAIGAGTGDSRLVDRTLLEGARESGQDDYKFPVKVTLATNLDIERPLAN
jgi:hypothetical protein